MSTVQKKPDPAVDSRDDELKKVISKLIQRQDLNAKETQQALSEIVAGASAEQTAAFLVLLRTKGETAAEIYGLVKAMREVMQSVELDFPVLDIVGTGGDGANTVNISTAASIVAASCGAKVAKHGNRSVSSKCGSADVLEKLGIQLACSADEVADCIKKIGIGFCFAPSFHPAMKKIKSVRSALAVPTVFNLLGPLLNPACASYYLMGVYSQDYLSLLADALSELSIKRALVVHGSGLDELNLLGPAQVVEIHQIDKGIVDKKTYELDPKKFGFQYGKLSDLKGGDAKCNAKLLKAAFNGEKGPISDTIALNAGAALYVAEMAESIAEGIIMAQESLQKQKASELLNKWVGLN